eukprot:158210-Prymnesium_polylepis.1
MAEELIRYHTQLLRLEKRFDKRGAELGLTFIWRNAWRSKDKVEQHDLSWERLGVLFSAAAAY